MGFMVDRKHRDLSDEDIAKLADTFTAFQNGELEEVKGFCAVATTEEIAKQDYILTPGRYVGIEEQEVVLNVFRERQNLDLIVVYANKEELEKEEVRIKERGINGLGENLYREKDTEHNGGNERERGGILRFCKGKP